MDEFENFYNKALKFLSYRPRSEKEVRDRFKIKNQKSKIKISDKTIDLIIKKLKDYKFLDDFEFAKMWLKDRLILKLKPIRIIKSKKILANQSCSVIKFNDPKV